MYFPCRLAPRLNDFREDKLTPGSIAGQLTSSQSRIVHRTMHDLPRTRRSAMHQSSTLYIGMKGIAAREGTKRNKPPNPDYSRDGGIDYRKAGVRAQVMEVCGALGRVAMRAKLATLGKASVSLPTRRYPDSPGLPA